LHGLKSNKNYTTIILRACQDEDRNFRLIQYGYVHTKKAYFRDFVTY